MRHRWIVLLIVGLAGCATAVEDSSGTVRRVDAAAKDTLEDEDASIVDSSTLDATEDPDSAAIDSGELDTGELDTGDEFPDTGDEFPDTGSPVDDTGPTGDTTCLYCTTGVCADKLAEEDCFVECVLYEGYFDCTYDPSSPPACKCHD